MMYLANEEDGIRFDAAAFAAANDNIDEILEYHEIEEILEYLQSIYQAKAPAGKQLGKQTATPMKAENPRDSFERFYQALRTQYGQDAGSWYEFMSAVETMAKADMAEGYKIPKTGQAKDWYEARFDYETYTAVLSEVRSREKNEEKENFLVALINLCNEEAAGGKPDYRAFLKNQHEILMRMYPDDALAADEYVFLLSVRELTESLMPKPEDETEAGAEAEADTAIEGSEEAASEEAAEIIEFDDESAAAAEAAEIERLAKQRTRFDGSYVKIMSKMQQKQRQLERTDPVHREAFFNTKLAEEAQNRANIGSAISVFWRVVAKYLLFFVIGLAMILISVISKRVMDNVLLSREIKATKNAEAERAVHQQQSEADDEEKNALLRVSHLKQYFRSGNYVNKAVDDISFYIKKGEVFGLVGESGCGKTTTGRTIINLYDPTEGDVYFEGLRISSNLNGYPVLRKSLRNDFNMACKQLKEETEKKIQEEPERREELLAEQKKKISEMKAELKKRKAEAETNAMLSQIEQKRATHFYREKRKAELTAAYENESRNLSGQELEERRRRYHQEMKVAGKDNIMTKMQMIFQDPIASINPRMTVREIIAEGLIIQGVKDKKYINEKVYEMLELVGLVREHADRYPHEFSGGQRQRIGIARAIIMNPDLIIADEPISALDVSIQAQVINLLNDLRNRMGLTLMFIAHNLSVVKYFSDRIAVMYYGKIVEMTTSDELFKHPLHPYTKSLLSAIPYPDPHYEKMRKRIEYNPATAHDYSVDKPTLREIVPGHFIYCNDAEFAAYQEEISK